FLRIAANNRLRRSAFSIRPFPLKALTRRFQLFRSRVKSFLIYAYFRLTASRSEGFNLPAMEAMACRTPVVSTRTGWPAEAVKTGINGVLVDVEDQVG